MKHGHNNQVSIFAPEQNAILDVNFPVNLKYKRTDQVVHTGRFPLGPPSVKTVPGKGACGGSLVHRVYFQYYNVHSEVYSLDSE